MNTPADTEFTALQLQRFGKALEEYWNEPAHSKFRNDPRLQDESVLIASWHARANVMSDDEFNALTSDLFQRAEEGGDLGYSFWSRIISNLKELRRLPLKQD